VPLMEVGGVAVKRGNKTSEFKAFERKTCNCFFFSNFDFLKKKLFYFIKQRMVVFVHILKMHLNKKKGEK